MKGPRAEKYSHRGHSRENIGFIHASIVEEHKMSISGHSKQFS